MPKVKIIYQAPQDVMGKHLKSREWIYFSGNLTIYDRKLNPIVIRLKKETTDYFLAGLIENKKEFKGKSITEVYGKISKWYYLNGIIFQN